MLLSHSFLILIGPVDDNNKNVIGSRAESTQSRTDDASFYAGMRRYIENAKFTLLPIE